MSDDDLVEVRLLELPVPLWERGQEQHEALQREFALAANDPQGVPARLLELMAALRERYAAGTTAQEQQLLDAAEAGVEVLPELVYRVPAAVGPAVHELGLLLDEADEHCRQGEHLLTLAPDEELVRFRWWYLDAFSDQAAGRPPVPWPQYRRG